MTHRRVAPSGAVTGLAAVALDCTEPVALASFWQQLLGGEVLVHDDDLVELVGGVLRMDFARASGPKGSKNRVHLDLSTTDLDAAVRQARDAGAQPAEDVYAGRRWAVLRDPEGNEFCLLRPAGDPLREVGS